MLRSCLAVLAGYLLIAFLVVPLNGYAAHLAAPGARPQLVYLAVHLGAEFLAAFGGGYLCAVIARAPWPGRILAALVLISHLAYVNAATSNPGTYFLLLPFAGGLGAFVGSWARTS